MSIFTNNPLSTQSDHPSDDGEAGSENQVASGTAGHAIETPPQQPVHAEIDGQEGTCCWSGQGHPPHRPGFKRDGRDRQCCFEPVGGLFL